MTIDYLTLEIQYDLKADAFNLSGSLSEAGRKEVLESFLRSQVGSGRDNSQPKIQVVYHINLRWYPSDDRITVEYDTGNKGFRDSLLIDLLGKL